MEMTAPMQPLCNFTETAGSLEGFVKWIEVQGDL